MFLRTKKSGPRSYLQIVENHWRDGRPQQTVLATLGRLDPLPTSGRIDGLLPSRARLAQEHLPARGAPRGASPGDPTPPLGSAAGLRKTLAANRLPGRAGRTAARPPL